MSPETSPEDKLLKLIRQKKSLTPEVPIIPSSAPASSELLSSSGSVSDPNQWVSFLNKVLILVVVLIGIYTLSQLFITPKDPNDKKLVEEPGMAKVEPEPTIVKPLKSYSDYAQTIAQRNIFELPTFPSVIQIENPPVVVPSGENPPPSNVSSAVDFIKKLKLVGIVLDATPEAIIEDTQAKQTLFLHPGELIDDAIVEDIQESKVILKYQNQRIELVQ